jgi:hypothetical protein
MIVWRIWSLCSIETYFIHNEGPEHLVYTEITFEAYGDEEVKYSSWY